MTVLVGAAPCTGDEAGQMIGLNADAHRLVQKGDVEGPRRLVGTPPGPADGASPGRSAALGSVYCWIVPLLMSLARLVRECTPSLS